MFAPRTPHAIGHTFSEAFPTCSHAFGIFVFLVRLRVLHLRPQRMHGQYVGHVLVCVMQNCLPMISVPYAFFCVPTSARTENIPIDHWKYLKRLTFKGLRVGTTPHDLVQWLDKRASSKQAPLPVTFSHFRTPRGVYTGAWLASLYKCLHHRCRLKLKKFPLRATLNVYPSAHVDILDSRRDCESIGLTIDERL